MLQSDDSGNQRKTSGRALLEVLEIYQQSGWFSLGDLAIESRPSELAAHESE